MDEEPLGTWPTWLADGVVAGALMPLSAFLGALSYAVVVRPGGSTDRLWLPVVLLTVVGGAMATTAAPPLWWAATRWWRRSPVGVLSLGPLAGGIGALVLVSAVEWLISGRVPAMRWWHAVILSAAGGTVLGVPWIAYLAVRARQRRGLGVVAGSVVWAASSGFVLMAVLLLGGF